MRVSITKPRHLQGTDKSYVAGLGFNPYKYVPHENENFYCSQLGGSRGGYFLSFKATTILILTLYNLISPKRIVVNVRAKLHDLFV